ncbi:hypothetical protein C9374_012147 [Naegleria lovaniensis]|uniref:Uncharacterized protein n=1 Tax=Naegleria lovaniensis TaxID=51637 RepID=A0AA88GEJ2_NAELO|nr:uncharacterized protein C9374_012147 [Naegleria lovaniensis]KAG2373408.1 hypothetical protein C9374_012147 [Naegleria lovaniensis]
MSDSLPSDDPKLSVFEVPDAFGIVEEGIYRSSIPKHEKQFQFIKTLRLKTMLFLSQEIILKSFLTFLEEEQIEIIELGLLISHRILSGGVKNQVMANGSSQVKPRTPVSASTPPPQSSLPNFQLATSVNSSTNTNTTQISSSSSASALNTPSATTTPSSSTSSNSTSSHLNPSKSSSTLQHVPPVLQIKNNMSLNLLNTSLSKSLYSDEIYNTKHCTDELIKEALEILMNKKYHPIMVVCSSGIHLTGTLIGCMRKLQDWSLTSIFTEYECFAGNNARHIDQQFIEMFDTDLTTLPTEESGNLPQWFIEHKQMKQQEEREYEDMMKQLLLNKKHAQPSTAPTATSISSTTRPHSPSGQHFTSSSQSSGESGQQHLHIHHTRTSSIPLSGLDLQSSVPNLTQPSNTTSHASHTSISLSRSATLSGISRIGKTNSNDNIHGSSLAVQQDHGLDHHAQALSPQQHVDSTSGHNNHHPFKYTFQRYLLDQHCPLISEKSTYSSSSVIEDEDD